MEFGKESAAADVVAGHDLHGRDVLVTGGSSGIGVETARALAAAGARVLITGRDVDKGQAVMARLRVDTGNPAIEFERLELGQLSDVARFVERFRATNRPLSLLINNAAVLSSSLRHTVDGFEWQLGVNHLGHFALTLGLLPALRAAGTARVIALTSRAHRYSDIDFDDPNYQRRGYETWPAYGQSKTATALFAVGLTGRHAADGITANAVMPGMVVTDLPRNMSRADLLARGWIDADGNLVDQPGWKTAEQGAATTLWAALAPELEGVGGRYLENCAVGTPWAESADTAKLPVGQHLPFLLDADRATRLWSLSEALIEQAGVNVSC